MSMRFAVALITIFLTLPALADPTHVEQAGGHNHWFELALAGVAIAVLAAWLVAGWIRTTASDRG